MKKTVHRFEVAADDTWNTFHCPDGPILAVGNKGPTIVEFWCEAESSKTYGLRSFRVFGTGHPVPGYAVHVGTAPRNALGLVWHIYESKEDADEYILLCKHKWRD